MSGPYRFRTLGSIDLTAADGARVLSVLSRPKLLGLFAYLACPSPERMRTRDELMALFWPESDPQRSRGSLRKALHTLRGSLGSRAVVGTGDLHVGLDPELFEIDVSELEGLARSDSVDELREIYRGPFLHGYVMDAGNEVQDWLDAERLRLRDLAADTALRAAHESLELGDPGRAEELAAWSLDVRPMDEQAFRLRIEALAALGDRARAAEAYGDFEQTLKAETDRAPSPETRHLMEDLEGSEAIGSVPSAVARSTKMPLSEESSENRSGARKRRRPMVAAALTLVALAALIIGPLGLDTLGGTDADVPTVVVLPFAVPSDDPGAQGVANALRDDLIVGLVSQPGLRIFAASGRAGETHDEVGVRLHAQMGADAVVAGTSRVDGDRVHVTALLLDAATGEVRWSATTQRGMESTFGIADELAASLAEALEVTPLIPGTRETATGPRYADVRRAVEEARVRYNRGLPGGEELALQALGLDSTYAPAWAARAYYLALRGRNADAAALDSARWAAERAVALDPGHRYGHVVLASVAAWRGERLAQLDHVLEALAVQPGYWAGLLQLGRVFRSADRFDHAVRAQALAELLGDASESGEDRYRFELRFLSGETDDMMLALEGELEGDPSPSRRRRLALGLLAAERHDEARRLAQEASEETESPGVADLRSALIEVWDGRCDLAEPRLLRARDAGLGLDMGTSTVTSTLLAHCALQVGEREAAAGWITESLTLDRQRLREGPGGEHALYDLARIGALLNDPEETARWLARADSAGWEWVNTYMGRRDPLLASVRDAPAVAGVLARMSRRQEGMGRALDDHLDGEPELSYEELIREARIIRDEWAQARGSGRIGPHRTTVPERVPEWLDGLEELHSRLIRAAPAPP